MNFTLPHRNDSSLQNSNSRYPTNPFYSQLSKRDLYYTKTATSILVLFLTFRLSSGMLYLECAEASRRAMTQV